MNQCKTEAVIWQFVCSFHTVGKHLYILDKKLMPSNVNDFKCIINGAYGSVQDVDTTMAKGEGRYCSAAIVQSSLNHFK